jgi:TRAP-type C4-dicarboxylate transport system permease small subunit
VAGERWRGTVLGRRLRFTFALIRTYRVVFSIIDVGSMVALVAIGILVLISVVVNYFGLMQGSLSWIEQLAGYIFIWLVFLGSAVALEERKHITVDLVEKRLPVAAVGYYRALIQLVILAVLVVLTWQGVDIVLQLRDEQAGSIGIPISLVYLSIPIGGAVMILRTLGAIVAALAGVPDPPQQVDGGV